MESESFGVEVISYTTHLDGKLCIARATVGVRGSEECDGVVALLDDEHTGNFLVAVYDEVAAEFVGVFIELD